MPGIVRQGKLRLVVATASVAFAAGCLLLLVIAGDAETARPKSPVREILVVSNNWDGTVDLVDVHSFKRLKRINIVPDRAERMTEIETNPDKLGFYLAIRQQIGEGHDQLADDGFTSPDGRFLYISRPSFADVVAINMRTGKIKWRTPVAGYRSDHMAISHNGKRLLVSASTANVVQQIDTATGKVTGSFPSGDSPHESNFSRDGKRIYHASIGRVYTPTDDPSQEASKGDAHFEIVNARTLKIIKKLDMGEELRKAGYPDMSSAVRPMTISPDERYLYFQVSFFHGFVEYDLKRYRVTRVAQLPESAEAQQLSRQDYILDSAHHGIAMNNAGTKLCVAGTMDDYAAIVSRKTFRYKLIQVGDRPYWSTPSVDGRYCFLSIAGDDRVAVVSYKLAKEVASIPVGDHPQRLRTGVVRRDFLH